MKQNEFLHKFVDFHNQSHPDKYIPNSEIGRFNMSVHSVHSVQLECDHYFSLSGDEEIGYNYLPCEFCGVTREPIGDVQG